MFFRHPRFLGSVDQSLPIGEELIDIPEAGVLNLLYDAGYGHRQLRNLSFEAVDPIDQRLPLSQQLVDIADSSGVLQFSDHSGQSIRQLLDAGLQFGDPIAQRLLYGGSGCCFQFAGPGRTRARGCGNCCGGAIGYITRRILLLWSLRSRPDCDQEPGKDEPAW